MAAFCMSCGARLAAATAHFCAECGAPVPRSAATAGGPSVAPPTASPPPPAPPAAAAPGPTRAAASLEPARATTSLGRRILGALGSLAEAAAAGGLAGEVANDVMGALERRGFATLTHPRGHAVVVGACKKDEHDPSDPHYDVHRNVDPANLPGFVDLREWLTPVEDQGELGSCTANAIAGAYEYLEKRTTGREGEVSRLFVYFQERKLEGNEREDSGATLRNGMKVLQQLGACSERTWPYDIHAFAREPDESAYTEAEQHQIDEYRRVPVDAHAMKTCLAEGYPFVFGMRIYKPFEDDGQHGRISLPRAGDKDMGSHAMLACGYSDKDEVFVVRNSWGTDWGDQGYCYVPYAYLGDPQLTDDCWTVRRAHNLDFTQSAEPGGSAHPSGRMSFFDEVVSIVENESESESASVSQSASASEDQSVSGDVGESASSADDSADASDDDSDTSDDSNTSDDSDTSDDSADTSNNDSDQSDTSDDDSKG